RRHTNWPRDWSSDVCSSDLYQNGYENRNSTGFPPPIEEGDLNSQRTDQNYISDWTHILGSNSVLDVRASFGRFTSIFPRISDYKIGRASCRERVEERAGRVA